jgi:hypothetical protein
VTIAKRPLDLARDARIVSVIWVKREAEFFDPPDWTGQISLSCNEKFDFWRTRFLRQASRKQGHPPIQLCFPETDLRFAHKATQSLHSGEMTRWDVG